MSEKKRYYTKIICKLKKIVSDVKKSKIRTLSAKYLFSLDDFLHTFLG